MAKATYDYVEEKKFKPVKITCTLETQEELNAFTAAFNYMPIYKAKGVKYGWCECFREIGKALGGDSSTLIFCHFDKRGK